MMEIVRTVKKILAHPLKDSYYVGFLKESDLSLPIVERYSSIRWLDVRKYESEGWFADPFILSVKNNIIELFAEEMIYKTGRGILVYLKIDICTCDILEKHIILELDTHLSFPIYIRDNGKLYVYPENYQSGSLKIYEYDEVSKCLQNPQTIIKAPLLDTQIIQLNNSYYAFGILYKTGNQKDTKELCIYNSPNLFGDYKLIQVIQNSRCEERGAGLIFSEDNRIIRPAQSCEGGYGKEIIFYDLQYHGDRFYEEEVGRLVPDRNAANGSILHTYNKLDGWVTVDGWRYYRPWIASLYKKVRRIDM